MFIAFSVTYAALAQATFRVDFSSARFQSQVFETGTAVWEACDKVPDSKLLPGILNIKVYSAGKRPMWVNYDGLPISTLNTTAARESFQADARRTLPAGPWCEVFSLNGKKWTRRVSDWSHFSESGAEDFQKELLGENLSRWLRLEYFRIQSATLPYSNLIVMCFFSLKQEEISKRMLEQLQGRLRSFIEDERVPLFIWAGSIDEVDGFPVASPLQQELLGRLGRLKQKRVHSCVSGGKQKVDCQLNWLKLRQ